jgi:hypothetical protein
MKNLGMTNNTGKGYFINPFMIFMSFMVKASVLPLGFLAASRETVFDSISLLFMLFMVTSYCRWPDVR